MLSSLVVRHWSRLSREMMGVPSPEVFKAKLEGAPSSLVQWRVSLPRARGLEPQDPLPTQTILRIRD